MSNLYVFAFLPPHYVFPLFFLPFASNASWRGGGSKMHGRAPAGLSFLKFNFILLLNN